MQHSNDPIFQDAEDQQWYFWDEIWSFNHGPYDTEAIAREKLREYAATI